MISYCNSVVAVKEPHSKALASLPVPPERDLAGALHEVSNALTVVLGWLDNALAACAPEEQSRAAQDGATRHAIEIARCHASLGHAIARRAVGAPVAEGAELRSALTLVRDTVTGVLPIADRRGISIDIDDDVADVLLPDALFVQQILINLLLNALAFTPRRSGSRCATSAAASCFECETMARAYRKTSATGSSRRAPRGVRAALASASRIRTIWPRAVAEP